MFQPQVCEGLMAVLAIGIFLHSCTLQRSWVVWMCLWEQGEPGLSHQSEDPKWSFSHPEAQKVMA